MTALEPRALAGATDVAAPPGHPLLAQLGDPHARLLSGPPLPETLAAHLRRTGLLDLSDPDRLCAEVEASGLRGRGGGEFPLAYKLSAARNGSGPPTVVANGSEGEPASRKDALLLEYRPHLVLDGLAVAAAACGAEGAAVYVHPGRGAHSVAAAVGERRATGVDPCPVTVVEAPRHFVAGESSSVVSFLERRDARPRRSPVPTAVSGVGGRPTVVSNAETLAHLALIARHGAGWFRQAGSERVPGSTLLTLAGAVWAPGQVAEVLGPLSLGAVLAALGRLPGPPPAVLVGGYGGGWIGGEAAWELPAERGGLRQAGAELGCGLVAPLAPGACGLRTTLDLLSYLAAQSAGQCGACVLGLASMADDLGSVVEGTARRGDVRRLAARCHALRGAGGCAHPDGAVLLVESALAVFADDVAAHLRGRPCPPGRSGGWFPTSAAEDGPAG